VDRNLRAFLAVARAGNLTTAADLVGLTQPALTKTIRRIEAELGARLFERSSKGMALTEVGEIFLARARLIEMNWTQMREEVHARTQGALAEFHIAAGAAYNPWIAPQLLRQLAAEFPHTRFVLESDVAGAMLPKVQSGEVHLLLGAFIQPVPEGVVTEKLMNVVTGVFCCRRNPLAQLASVTPHALLDTRWVIYKRDADMHRRLASYFLQFQMPAPRVVMEIDALASTMTVLAGSDLVTAAPVTISPLAEEYGLVQLPLEVPIWSFPSGAWMRRSAAEYPILKRSLTLVRQLVAGAEGHSGELLLQPD
jgi:DNA-binding transcriptional LysR family regulator